MLLPYLYVVVIYLLEFVTCCVEWLAILISWDRLLCLYLFEFSWFVYAFLRYCPGPKAKTFWKYLLLVLFLCDLTGG